MSDEFSTDLILSALSEEDKGVVRVELLRERLRGNTSQTRDLVPKLQKAFPSLSYDTLQRIESDPSFIDEMIQTHLAATSGEMGEVLRVIIEKAKEGNPQFARLYFEILKTLNRMPHTVNATQNNFNVSPSESMEKNYERFKNTAKRMGG